MLLQLTIFHRVADDAITDEPRVAPARRLRQVFHIRPTAKSRVDGSDSEWISCEVPWCNGEHSGL
jgi:hypothetical protein